MAVPEFYSGKVLYPAVAVLIGLSALFGLAVMPRLALGGSNGLVGKPAPDFTLSVAANGDDGARMHLEELSGRPVLIDFWATWCGPCSLQAPILDRLSRKYESRGLVVVGVNADAPPAAIRAYTHKKGLSYPQLIDEDERTLRAYGVSSFPTVIVVGKDGNVKAFYAGLVDEGSLDDAIASAL